MKKGGVLLIVLLTILLVSCTSNNPNTSETSSNNVDSSSSNQNSPEQGPCLEKYKNNAGELYYNAEDAQEQFGGVWEESISTKHCYVFVINAQYRLQLYLEHGKDNPETFYNILGTGPDLRVEGDIQHYPIPGTGITGSIQKIPGIGDLAMMVYN